MTQRITKHNFSDGAVLSAERIEAAWSDIEHRFAALKMQDVENKFWETQLVFGYMGRVVDWEPDGLGTGHPHEMPWLPCPTHFGGVSAAKGVDFPGIFPPDYGRIYCWGISWNTGTTPQVITAADICFDTDNTDTYYSTFWQWAANTPPGLSAEDFVEDCGLIILVDHPTDPGNPDTTAVAVYRAGISVDTSIQTTHPLFGSSMVPSHPGGDINGVWIHAKDLKIPVPTGSRVRMLLVLPDYIDSLAEDGTRISAGDVRWRSTVSAPWALQAYSGSVTVLLPRGE